MARWQLVDKVMFVQAFTMNSTGKPPAELPFPHILDQRVYEINKLKATYTQLSDAEAFITRFIVMGVDDGLIPQILASETGASNPGAAVRDVVNLLNSHGYLQPRGPRTYDNTLDSSYPREGTQDKHNKHTLDFNCNWFGTGQSKVPY